MLNKNDVITSYRDRIKAVLETTACGLDNGFNVYSDEDFRSQTVPVAPYIYLISTYIRPAQLPLPFIGIQVAAVEGNPFELGRATGNLWDIRAHVFGRTMGQRNQLSSYLGNASIVGDIPIYDVSTGSLIETAKHLADRRTIIEAPPLDEEDVEGSWRYKDYISSYYQTVS